MTLVTKIANITLIFPAPNGLGAVDNEPDQMIHPCRTSR